MGQRLLHLFFFFLAGSAAADTLEVLSTLPHSGYSEGLEFHDGFLWHALPQHLIKIDPQTGKVLERYTPATSYSESLTWFHGSLWNVSFADNGIYKGTLKGGVLQFQRVGDTPEKHAWGLTHDGRHLILTGNYSSQLYFVSPQTLKVQKKVTVPVKDLEDLAWDGIGIWTSSFTERRGQVFRVNPQDGSVNTFYALPDPEACPIIDGIAYSNEKLWITGKNCPSIWVVKRPAERAISSGEITKKEKTRSR